MSLYVIALINAVLATLVLGGIVGLMHWSVLTQHRDHGCGEVRLLRRRLATRGQRLVRELERPTQEVVLG
jgi:hypothetical protein